MCYLKYLISLLFALMLHINIAKCQEINWDSITKAHCNIDKKIINDKYLAIISEYWKLDSTGSFNYREYVGRQLAYFRIKNKYFKKVKYFFLINNLGKPNKTIDYGEPNQRKDIRYFCSVDYNNVPYTYVKFVFNKKEKLIKVYYQGVE